MSRVYGHNAVGELLQHAASAVTGVWVTAESASKHRALIASAEKHGVTIHYVSADALKRRSGGRGGAGIAADVRPAAAIDLGSVGPNPGRQPVLIALDRVTDPHNLGAILRSAAAFGARAVIVGRDRAAPLNDAAVRASAGAVAHVPLVRVTNLPRALRQLSDQGVWTLALTADADAALWQVDLDRPVVLVLGAEGQGIRPGVLKACEIRAKLPLVPSIGSLNVSVTAGIALAEVARQKSASG